ncbi:chymase-like [Sminthopsis crassicaudata]|uniref:chymase-like n=1 Tax=Sminthopsis crassicaudata TaxID=9301 RepID=UPI003D684383
MKLLCLLLLLLTFLLAHETGADEILGGKEARRHSRPYMAFLDIKLCNDLFSCGGFLIRNDFVMTAAHCVGDFISVRLGAHNINKREETWQIINVTKQFPHPEYNAERLLNDIMLLKLEKKAKQTTAVRPIPLPSTSNSVLPGKECIIAGWGGTKLKSSGSDTLQEAEVRVTNPIYCKNFTCFDERSLLCVGTPKSIKTTFSGDSGGPLVCSGVAHGIVSYGNNKYPPSVFTKIAHYSSWINQILNAN